MTRQIIVPDQLSAVYLGSRPDFLPPSERKFAVNHRTGATRVMSERGLVVNSLLLHDEWQQMDAVVQRAARNRLTAVNDLKAMPGGIKLVNSIGVLTTMWGRSGEMTGANVSMTGVAVGERDRLEHDIVGRPIPIVFKDFNIPTRQLAASRLAGMPLDTTTVFEATRVVAEELESLLINGDSTVIFDGNTIYGYTTEPNVNTVVASGDFGTLSNVVPTVAAMIIAAAADNYFGPYVLYLPTTQFNEISTNFYTDSNSESGLQRILRMPQISAVRPLDNLTSGTLLLVQMSEDVADWAQHMDITAVEWLSNDGMVGHFRVMAVATPRVKSDKNSRSGIVKATGA